MVNGTCLSEHLQVNTQCKVCVYGNYAITELWETRMLRKDNEKVAVGAGWCEKCITMLCFVL